MSQELTRTLVRWLLTIGSFASSGFLSMVILAACVIPVAWALQFNVSDIGESSVGTAQACGIAIYLAAAIGISTFIATYVLIGHPTAYVGPLFVSLPVALRHHVIFILVLVPIILGAIAGHYLNRYSKFKIEQNENPTVASFVSLRLACGCGAALLTLALVDSQLHWTAYVYWMVIMSLYLTPSCLVIWQRAEAQIAA